MSVVWRQRFRKILASSAMPSEGSLPAQLHSRQANVSLLRVPEIQKLLSLAYHQTSSAWHRYRFIIRDGMNPDVATSRRDRAYLIKLLFFRLLSNETTLLALFSEIKKFHKRIGSDSPCSAFLAIQSLFLSSRFLMCGHCSGMETICEIKMTVTCHHGKHLCENHS